ncbi:MAG: GIY-YIG nuclease family protein, partial [Syntrophales bacterium]
RELGDSSVPFEFDVHAMIFSEDAPALENRLHKHFVMMQMNKVNYRKEFFKVDIGHIREEVEKFGLVAKWTMTALAQEYHQSMVIEKTIKEDPATRDAWIKRQLLLEPATVLAGGDIAGNGDDDGTSP